MGTPFTAQLQLATNDAVLNAVTGVYRLKIEDNQTTYGANSLDARINIAIDKGLWWLFKNGAESGSYMTWHQSSYTDTYVSPTASVIQAFAINNHKITKDPVPDVDPYVEAVTAGMNYLTKGGALNAVAIGNSTYDLNHNGFGVQTTSVSPIYEGGQVMDAIISSGVQPSDSTGRSFNNGGHIWTYGELLQDLADMYTYGQHSPSGAWAEWDWSGWQYDNSSSQWAAIGYLPAQSAPWNVSVPQFVKDQNKRWLSDSYCNIGSSSSPYGYFGYQSACGNNDNALNTTACGMVQMDLDDLVGYDNPSTTADEREAKWIGAERYMADNWRLLLETTSPNWGGNRTYGFYSFAKAMRLAKPQPVETITKRNGVTFDWYRGGSSFADDGSYNKGLAQRLVELQTAAGSWTGNLTNEPLTTAWMVITLRPTLFASAPTACFTANPNPTYSKADIVFDPSCSGHSETGKTIANLTNFQWDWENDGIFDASSSSPTPQTHSFTCAPPCSKSVKLKVTDDSTPPLTATAVVEIKITNPPHPPVANAGGPYTASLCSGDTLVLDGSKSIHPDLGQFEAGCTDCPGAKIATWSWDVVAPLTFDTINASSADPVKTAAITPASYFAAGTTTIALQATDNSRLAFPNSGNTTNLTGTAFGTVNAKAGCLCSITARAKTGMVQLSWAATEHSATTAYDIYRSTEGPNTGFTRIRSGYTNTYPVFVDTGLTNGTTYFYRIEKSGGACGSKAVSGKPMAI